LRTILTAVKSQGARLQRLRKPIEPPTKCELAINLKTAVGIAIPPSRLVQADETVE